MSMPRFKWLAAIAFTAALGGLALAGQQPAGPGASLPSRLGDQEFWTLSTGLSEPAGYFQSENLVSNEHTFQYVIPTLVRQVSRGGVYLGVAPDQNFTYIAATAPRLAFIVDIRRGNLLEQLMYKALFELSRDRADFVSRLFSKPRPSGLGLDSTVLQIFRAFDAVDTREDLYRQNLQAITDLLVHRHGFVLSPDDLGQLQSIYYAFFWDGPSLRYEVDSRFGRTILGFPTYEELMQQTDATGTPHSYLATARAFRAIKAMQEKNLIVPVVGNFAGPKALRGVGRYIREHHATVTTFYVSNVEQYLYQEGQFDSFARNVATLPVDDSSTFVRSVSIRFGYQGSLLGPDGRATALYPIRDFIRDFEAGRLSSYFELNRLSR